eukprot:1176873-Prorocentrum_minimum.AAC.4
MASSAVARSSGPGCRAELRTELSHLRASPLTTVASASSCRVVKAIAPVAGMRRRASRCASRWGTVSGDAHSQRLVTVRAELNQAEETFKNKFFEPMDDDDEGWEDDDDGEIFNFETGWKLDGEDDEDTEDSDAQKRSAEIIAGLSITPKLRKQLERMEPWGWSSRALVLQTVSGPGPMR